MRVKAHFPSAPIDSASEKEASSSRQAEHIHRDIYESAPSIISQLTMVTEPPEHTTQGDWWRSVEATSGAVATEPINIDVQGENLWGLLISIAASDESHRLFFSC